MVGERPKSSLVGIGDFALSAYNTREMKKMGKEIESFNQDIAKRINEQTVVQLELMAQQDIQSRLNHFETLLKFQNLNKEILKIGGIIDSIDGRLSRIENKDLAVGELKLSLIAIEDEIEKIKLIPNAYPEFAALMAENLELVIGDLGLENIKFLSIEEIKWARKIIAEVGQIKEDAFQEIML